LFIHLKAKEIADAFTKGNTLLASASGSRTQENLIQWIPPPERWTKLNVDGASKGNAGAARAWRILRGHYGIKGFALNLRVCTSVKAELIALFQGLKLAMNQGIDKLLVDTDSQVVFNKLKVHPPKQRGYYYLVKKCQDLLNDPEWDVLVEHCYR